MKCTSIALLLLCSGFVYDLHLLTEQSRPQPTANFTRIPAVLNEAKPAVFVPVPNIHVLIRAAARKHKVPAAFVKSIVAAESNFNCAAVSEKGAIGLMQLMPETAEQFGVDPTLPEENIDGGTRYLRVLLDRYKGHRNGLVKAIAAYNAGPAVVDRYRGVPPFPETRSYVARVLAFFHRFQKEGA